jgi:hypothetical protein
MQKEFSGTKTGLVGYWEFNEEAGSSIAQDGSPNGNNQTFHGGQEFVKSGAF